MQEKASLFSVRPVRLMRCMTAFNDSLFSQVNDRASSPLDTSILEPVTFTHAPKKCRPSAPGLFTPDMSDRFVRTPLVEFFTSMPKPVSGPAVLTPVTLKPSVPTMPSPLRVARSSRLAILAADLKRGELTRLTVSEERRN